MVFCYEYDKKTEMKDIEINESLLLRFFAGETNDVESENIINWIRASDANHVMAKDVYYIYYSACLDKVEAETDVDAAFRCVENKIQPKKAKLNKQRIVRLLQQTAAIIVIPLCIFTTYLLVKDTPSRAYSVEVSAKKGMVTKTVLPDSTVVWLNSGSILKYPSVFDADYRDVELTGEAYFDVQQDLNKTFRINTGNYTIRVLGTEFNVEAYAEDEIATTTLVEGKVEIEYKDIRGNNQFTYLAPSQKLTFNKDSKDVNIEPVSVAQYIAWKDGKIIFEKTSLKDVLRMLGKHFNVDFVVKDEALYVNSFSGKFDGERLDEILNLIQISSNINYAYKSNASLNDKALIEIF